MATVTGPLSAGTLVKAATHASVSSQYGKKITSATKGTAASGWYWDTANIATGKLISHDNLKQESFKVSVKVTVKAPRAYTLTLEYPSGTVLQTKSGSAGQTTHTFTNVTNKNVNVIVRATLTGTSTSRNCGEYTAYQQKGTGTTNGATITTNNIVIPFWIFRSGYGKSDVGSLATWPSGVSYTTNSTSSLVMAHQAMDGGTQSAICISGLSVPAAYSTMYITTSMTDTFVSQGGNYAAAGLPGRTLIVYGRAGAGTISNVNNWTTYQGSSSWTSTQSNPAHYQGAKTMSFTVSSPTGVAITSANTYGYQTISCTSWYLT